MKQKKDLLPVIICVVVLLLLLRGFVWPDQPGILITDRASSWLRVDCVCVCPQSFAMGVSSLFILLLCGASTCSSAVVFVSLALGLCSFTSGWVSVAMSPLPTGSGSVQFSSRFICTAQYHVPRHIPTVECGTRSGHARPEKKKKDKHTRQQTIVGLLGI